ncbi:EEF1B [Acanthosepion pharaonis]|uniref:Elongation factor 1-beta n=1 Tax=Acanthosepion pharaonis TaxID=158019 RepID=A0A812DDK0_ACAPH|nr:EEF1B [Sepia pharaonis]
MGFGDLKSESGIKSLNDYLAKRSYIEGYEPSQADSVVFSCLSGPPDVNMFHVRRWYNHIASYGAETAKFPGEKKDVNAYGDVTSVPAQSSAPDEDDDIDLFGSDDDEECEKLRQQRLAEYAEKKAKKPALIAKSNIILDVKPWDDETDMQKMEECVRSIQTDGLLWGASKLLPVGYGIKKLQICCVVEDDKVGTDFLEEEITKFEDYVQSVDVAAFQKI